MHSPRDTPEILAWDEAPARVLEATGSSTSDRAVVIGICGPAGSGKSTLAGRVQALASARGESSVVVSTDRYLPDYAEVEESVRDRPEHSDLALLSSHLDGLRARRAVDVPIWSFHTHRREGTEPLGPAGLVVCEGLHALHTAVRARLDLAVFVEAGPSVRWSRWRRLEEIGERGWGVERAREYFESVAEPTFERVSRAYRASADYCVINDEGADGA